jgi:hypothetical protein
MLASTKISVPSNTGIINLLSFLDPFVLLLSLRPKYRMGTISRFLAFPSPRLAAGVSHAEIDGG